MTKKIKKSKDIIEHSVEDVQKMVKQDPFDKETKRRLETVEKELTEGFDFLGGCKKAASVFGSARFGFDSDVYKEAEKLSYKLSKEGFDIVTGGGPGIMEAANKGAYDAGGRSIGFTIGLPYEQVTNKYVKEEVSFHYFFTRKVMLAFSSLVYVFFPGGFGTMDEFFEMVTLIQTGKMDKIEVVLVNRPYWEPLLKYIEEVLYEAGSAIDKEDMDIYHLFDTGEEAFEYISSKKDKLFNHNNHN